MATVGTFYFDTNSFASATTIYDDAALTTVAQNGWYSDGTIVRQQISGVLYAAQSCSAPVPVVTPVSPTPVAPTPVQPQPVPVQPQPVPVQPQPVPVQPQPVPVQPQPVPVQPQPVPVPPAPVPIPPVPQPVPVAPCYIYNATNNGYGGDNQVGYYDCSGFTQYTNVLPGVPQSFCSTQIVYQGSAVNLTNTQQTCNQDP